MSYLVFYFTIMVRIHSHFKQSTSLGTLLQVGLHVRTGARGDQGRIENG